MKKVLLTLLILVVSVLLFAQEKVEWINVDEVLEKAIEYEGEGEYEKAVEELNKISKNDSSYYDALSSKAYYLLQLEEHEDAIKLTEEGINALYCTSKYYFILNNAVAYVGSEEYEKAIELYDEALLKYPKSYLFYYNKGVAYEGLNKYEEAAEMYKLAITYNPYHANSHLKLGSLCYQEHHISQSMMCLNLYLLLNPDGSSSYDVLDYYNKMVAVKNENEKHPGVEISVDDESFEEIDLIINNYAALSKKYKISNKMDLSLIKQNHALFSQLEDYEGNGGFWDLYYVPLFKYIYQNDLFDAFAYTITFSVKNEDLKSIVDKNISKIRDFIPVYRDKWVELIGQQNDLIDEEKTSVLYIYSDSYLQGYGKYENDVTIGKWIVFNEYGSIASRLEFDNEGEKHGSWTWYDENGIITEKGTYDHGLLTGEYFEYFDDGKLFKYTNYKEGNLHGISEEYNNEGALIESNFYHEGEFIEQSYYYYEIGESSIKYSIPYDSNNIDGLVHEYYPDGKLKSEIQFKGDERNGTDKSYYYNGQLKYEKEYVDGDLHGDFVEYHRNGNVSRKGKCIDGYFEGEWKAYYPNNVIAEELIYSKGSIDGIYKEYDTDGKIYFEFTYRKGEIIAYKYYDKNQAIIKEAKKHKGEFFYEGHAPNGNITREGLYDISGGKEGEWKYYSDNHVIQTIENYKTGNLEGTLKTYHNNGEIKSITPYVNDTAHGYYTAFYSNGQLMQQGWYNKGEQDGTWIDYYLNGEVEIENYYTNGKLYGLQKNYGVDGLITSVAHYVDDEIMTDKYYDQNGELYDLIDYTTDSSNISMTTKHTNGNVEIQAEMLFGRKHGEFIRYYFNGDVRLKGNYFNGERHGNWVWYFPNGNIETTGEYIFGNKNGSWKDFYDNNQLEQERIFVYGKLEGQEINYNRKGVLTQTRDYVNDNHHGEVTFYCEEGQLELTRYYDHGTFIGYSYLDENSVKIPMIEVKNETAKIIARFDNGNISREMEIVNGDFVNAYKEYYYSGQLYKDQNYLDDDLDGAYKVYYPDGKLKEERNYQLGYRFGEFKKFYPNENLKEIIPYVNSIKHGVYQKYDSDGKLIFEQEYFNGIVVSEKSFD